MQSSYEITPISPFWIFILEEPLGSFQVPTASPLQYIMSFLYWSEVWSLLLTNSLLPQALSVKTKPTINRDLSVLISIIPY